MKNDLLSTTTSKHLKTVKLQTIFMVSQQFQPLFIFIVFLFQQPKWIWIYFYVSSTFPHICFHHCCFVVFKNNIGTLLKVHWELHTHWVVATSGPAFLANFAQTTIVLWNETRGASDTMQICEVRPRVGKFGDGNCVVWHCTMGESFRWMVQ